MNQKLLQLFVTGPNNRSHNLYTQVNCNFLIQLKDCQINPHNSCVFSPQNQPPGISVISGYLW